MSEDKPKQETEIILPPGYVWNPSSNEEPKKQCTCGISAIGGGLHSDWCDLSEKKDEE